SSGQNWVSNLPLSDLEAEILPHGFIYKTVSSSEYGDLGSDTRFHRRHAVYVGLNVKHLAYNEVSDSCIESQNFETGFWCTKPMFMLDLRGKTGFRICHSLVLKLKFCHMASSTKQSRVQSKEISDPTLDSTEDMQCMQA
ncbi:hypothetical protein AVEN_82454-2-1, partial [Araneus ventricosus]